MTLETALKEAIVGRVGLGPARSRKAQLRGALTVPRLVAHELREASEAGPEAMIVTIVVTIGRPSIVSAVESALAQTVGDHAVLVVTDGPRALPPLPEGVSVLRTSRPCGSPSVVRNIGLRSSHSSFVAFLDDDNTWHADHLETCLTALAENQADVAYASANRFRPDGTLYDTIGQPFDRCALRATNYVDASAIVARRMRSLRWCWASRRGTHFGEDWELVYRLSRRHRIVWSGQTTLDYAVAAEKLAFLEAQRMANAITGDAAAAA